MYCGLKVIKDAVNPVLKTTAFFSFQMDMILISSNLPWLLNQQIVVCGFFIFKTSLVGGSVIKISYKKKVQQMKEQL